jgi:hypothetical protein
MVVLLAQIPVVGTPLQGSLALAQVPASEQLNPPAHEPQLPLHPSEPHCLPPQLGVQDWHAP